MRKNYMSTKFLNSEQQWKKEAADSSTRDYSFKSASGEEVDLLYYPDADKNNYSNYYELALCLLPSNGIIIIDNMLWGGNVADPSNNDNQTETIRSLNTKIQKDERVDFSLLPISDGLSFIRKK